MKKGFLLPICILLSVASWVSLSAQGRVGTPQTPKSTRVIVEDTLDLAVFHTLAVGINARVFLSVGSTQQVIVRSSEAVAPHLSRTVEDGVWTIKFNQNLNFSDSIQIYISLPAFRALSVGGSGSIVCLDAFSLQEPLSMVLGGSGMITLMGNAPEVQINVAGSGSILATGFQTAYAKVHLAGSGAVRIHATQQLEVSIAGNGNVWYVGNPNVKATVVGTGSVNPLN